MRRLVVPALAASLYLGCAGTATRPPASTTQHINTRIHMQGGVYSLDMTRTLNTWSVTLDAPAARVWRQVPDVYRELGLAGAGQLDGEPRVLAFNGRMPARIDGRRRSVFLRCGRGMTGDFADEYDVRLFVRTGVEEEGEQSHVATIVDASAVPRGVSGGSVPCTSTGELERAIAEALLRATVQ